MDRIRQKEIIMITVKKDLFLLVFATLFAFSGCFEEEKEHLATKKAPVFKVETVTVHKQKIPIWLRYTAITKASSKQEIRARVAGRLEKRFFKDGQIVEKGQKLFLIEQEQYKNALDAATAQKAHDLATLKLAKANVARYAPLAQEGLAPKAKLEEYQSQQAAFEAAIKADDAKIAEAKRNLAYTVIKAPITGKISARYVDVGNLVGYDGATLLTTIVQIDPLYAYFSPSESDYATIRHFADTQKLPAFAEVATKNEKFKRERLEGFVDFTNNTVDSTTSTITMRATLNNPQGNVLPGTFVYLNLFVTDKYPFIMIPPQTIFEDQEGKFVYVVGKNDTVERKRVQTGFSSRYFVQIEKGLEEGDRVIVSGLVKIQNGVKIEPIDATDTKGVMAIIKANNLIPKRGK